MLAPSGGGLIFYQAYGNLYAMTGRKANLLEDKQIPSVRVFDEVFSTWMTFGGNTRDLGSFGEEMDEITGLHQDSPRIMFSERGDDVTSTKRLRRDLFGDGVRDLAMASQRRRLKDKKIKATLEHHPNPHSQPDPLASIAAERTEDDGEVMFIEIIRDDDEPQNESPNEGEGTTTEGSAVEYFDTFPARDELTYHKNEEDKRRGVDYVMSKILGFYKECLELGPEYVTGLEDEGEVTSRVLYLMRRSLEVLSEFSLDDSRRMI
ncbi:hypothetical protein Tco_0506429 [Tanacetum coccineum]